MPRQAVDAPIIDKRHFFEDMCDVVIRIHQNIGESHDKGLARLLLYFIISYARNHLRRDRWNVRSVRER